jgi:hypothetical protein
MFPLPWICSPLHNVAPGVDVADAHGFWRRLAIFSIINAALLRSLPFIEAEWLVMIWQTYPDVPQARPALPDFADAPFKDAAVQIGSGKLVAKLFVRVLENPQINDLHGSEILR